LIEAAFGIHDLINETMAAAAKTHIAEKGGNPNNVTLTAFGGAGPVHAYGLARKIGAPRIIVPPLAGVGSALGFFTAPVAFDLVRSHRVGLDEADFQGIEKLFTDLEEEASAILKQSGDVDGIKFTRSTDMRFLGQGAETNLQIPNKAFNDWRKNEIRHFFDESYKRLYGRTYPDTQVEFISFRVRASLPQHPFQIPRIAPTEGTLQDCVKGNRTAFSLIQKQFITFTVFDRSKLFPGAGIKGPAIIEERESTIVLGEDANAEVDDYGFVWITFV
jgi:N-methylhydantoinase A